MVATTATQGLQRWFVLVQQDYILYPILFWLSLCYMHRCITARDLFVTDSMDAFAALFMQHLRGTGGSKGYGGISTAPDMGF